MASPQPQQMGTTSSAPTYPPPTAAVPPTPHPLAVLERYRPTTSGAVWRRSRLSISSLIGATVILVTWIVAAVWLYAIDFFLPLDFFGGLEDPTGENGEGFFHWSNRMYNNLITLLGTLSWVVISYALAVGFTTILRREFVKEDGISLSTFEALVKLSSQSLQLKIRWSALAALVVFAVAQLYPTATQAAFGSSFARTDISQAYKLPRLTSNAAALGRNGSFGTLVGFPFAEFSDATVLGIAGVYLPDDTNNTDFGILVGNILQPAQRGFPFFETDFLALDTQLAPDNRITPREQRLLNASVDLQVTTTVEGYFSRSQCGSTNISFTRQPVVNDSFFVYDFDFPCGPISLLYTADPPNRTPNNYVDFYVCPGEPLTVYLYVFDVLDGELSSANGFECRVQAWSELVDIIASTQRLDPGATSAAKVTGNVFGATSVVRERDDTRRTLDAEFGLAQSLGKESLQTRGLRGRVVLPIALALLAAANKTDFLQQYVEHLVETAVKLQLTSLSSAAFIILSQVPEEQLRFEPFERKVKIPCLLAFPDISDSFLLLWAQLQVQALQLHLSNLAWLVVPIVLLVAVVLIFPLFLTTTGMVDFIDPLSATLIALNSPLDPYVYGACTGDFPDHLSRATTGGKSKARAVKLRYGEQEWTKHGAPGHLVVAADPSVKAQLEAPVRGKKYA
ncbi:hypothetical protein JCM6882_009708 [Rhodosporidiobolus microsporus]